MLDLGIARSHSACVARTKLPADDLVPSQSLLFMQRNLKILFVCDVTRLRYLVPVPDFAVN